MQSKIFLYKIEGMSLESHSEQLRMSAPFDRKALVEDLKKQLNDDDYKIDETSLIYKVIDEQLYIQGLVVEKEAPKSVGFTFGKS